MSPRRIIFIAVALVMSVATMYLGHAYLQSQRRAQVVVQKAPAAPHTMVLVAHGDLAVGQFVRPENLRWQSWPDDSVSQNYVVQGKRPLEDFVGAVVRTGLSDGEPITETRVVRPGDRGFLAAVLTPGYRAVTVNVTPSSGVAGFVFPGDHVDLIATLALQEKKDKDGGDDLQHHASETVLTDLRVLALDQRVDDQKKEISVARTATLEVTPKQAEIIAVVGEIGKLSLSLRSLAHDEADMASETNNGRISYTFDSEATQLIAPPHVAGTTVKVNVVRAEKVTEVDLPRSNVR